MLADIQNEKDHRQIPLNRVGVRNVRYPIVLREMDGGYQNSIGVFSLSVDLPRDFRGTHMSRFVEILHNHASNMDLSNMRGILEDMKKHLNSNEAHLEMSFPYSVHKESPITRLSCLMVIDCGFFATLNHDHMDFALQVQVPIQTLCPCSKAISQFGAHNQKAWVYIKVKTKKMMWIEELIAIAQKSGSSEVYPLLKREDEKYVTEEAYLHPKFVEDVARDVALQLQKDIRVRSYHIQAISDESIHDHQAWASILWENNE